MRCVSTRNTPGRVRLWQNTINRQRANGNNRAHPQGDRVHRGLNSRIDCNMQPTASASRCVAACLLAGALAVGGCNGSPPAASVPETQQPDGTAAGSFFFRNVTAESGVRALYRNGEEAGHYAILEALGGGIALLDYDGDGLLDIFVPGGGYFEGEKILGHPCKLFK